MFVLYVYERRIGEDKYTLIKAYIFYRFVHVTLFLLYLREVYLKRAAVSMTMTVENPTESRELPLPYREASVSGSGERKSFLFMKNLQEIILRYN